MQMRVDRERESAQHQWFPHQVSKHCAQPPNWHCNWRLPLSAALLLLPLPGRQVPQKAITSWERTMPIKWTQMWIVVVAVQFYFHGCLSTAPASNNNNKREPPLPLSRVVTSPLSLSLTAVKLHTQSLRVSSNVRFGLARTLPVEK